MMDAVEWLEEQFTAAGNVRRTMDHNHPDYMYFVRNWYVGFQPMISLKDDGYDEDGAWEYHAKCPAADDYGLALVDHAIVTSPCP